DLNIAVSSFNAADLRRAGIEDVVVVPLLLDLPAEPAPLRDPASRPLLLTVGRVVPNKRLEDVIKVFALYRRHRASSARLTVVGTDEGFPGYRERLELLARSLAYGAVRFTGRVSSAKRDDWYDKASVYLCM